MARSLSRRARQTVAGYLFLSPAILFYLVFLLFPVGLSVYISFTNWNMLAPLERARWVGFSNYTYLLTRDDMFIASLKNTLVYALGTVFIGMAIALGVALLINNVRGSALWRFLIFAPVVTPAIAVGRIWGGIYHPSQGYLNQLLRAVGLPPQQWLSSAELALPSIMATAIWAGVGATVIVFIAGLRNIPAQYYEAARIDGARPWHEFWHITLPMLRPTVLFLSVTGLISAWQVFDLVYSMALGGTEAGTTPARAVMVVALYLYTTAFRNLRAGRATAGAMILFFIIFGLTLILLRVLRRGGLEAYE
ncbi:MAG TPA: sugar ABC transporter permease [Limnochordales bacterium]